MRQLAQIATENDLHIQVIFYNMLIVLSLYIIRVIYVSS